MYKCNTVYVEMVLLFVLTVKITYREIKELNIATHLLAIKVTVSYEYLFAKI